MSGALIADGVDGTADLETVSGAIILEGSRLSMGELRTISGDVTFAGRLAESGELELETDSGDIELRCCGQGGAELDLVTRHGEIVNEATEARPIRDSRGRRRLAVTLGAGAGSVEVRTQSGLVRLRPLESPKGEERLRVDQRKFSTRTSSDSPAGIST